MRRQIEFDDEALAQFPPTVQEALMRLAGQQAAERAPALHPGAPLKVVSRYTEADEKARVRSQSGPNGGRTLPDLLPADRHVAWRPKQ